MSDNSYLDISIYQIRLFLLMAEHCNFSKVASIAHLTQPTLSRRIAQLEQTLNMKLFERDSRPIALTPEGHILFEGWKDICHQVDAVINQARDWGNSSALNIGVVDSANAPPFSPVERFRRESPEIDLSVRFYSLAAWRGKLLSGEIDLLITSCFELEELDDNFVWEMLEIFPEEVCMLHTNPLARLDQLLVSDLKNQRFVLISPLHTPSYYRYIRRICNNYGFDPKPGTHVENAHNLLPSLKHNDEVVICDKYIRGIQDSKIKRFSLSEVSGGTCIIWKKGNGNKNIYKFAEFMKQLAKPHPEEQDLDP